MVNNIRKKRLGEQIQRELGKILLRGVKDPLFTKITITAVDVTVDLAIAKVFFTVFEDVEEKAATKALQQSAGFLRKLLARDLNLRVTPRLYFVYDDSLKQGSRLSFLIDAAIAADENKQKK